MMTGELEAANNNAIHKILFTFLSSAVKKQWNSLKSEQFFNIYCAQKLNEELVYKIILSHFHIKFPLFPKCSYLFYYNLLLIGGEERH